MIVKEMFNEKIHNFYCMLDITWMIKSRRMSGRVHVWHIKENRNAYKIFILIYRGKKIGLKIRNNRR